MAHHKSPNKWWYKHWSKHWINKLISCDLSRLAKVNEHTNLKYLKISDRSALARKVDSLNHNKYKINPIAWCWIVRKVFAAWYSTSKQRPLRNNFHQLGWKTYKYYNCHFWNTVRINHLNLNIKFKCSSQCSRD